MSTVSTLLQLYWVQVLGSVVYGGRITDSLDMHVLLALLRSFVRPSLLEDGFAYASDPAYKRPAAGSLQSYRCCCLGSEQSRTCLRTSTCDCSREH